MKIRKQSNESERGGALVMAVLATAMVATLATSMVVIQAAGAVEQGSARQENRALLAAEAGLSQSYIALQASKNGSIGSANAPATIAGGDVVVTTQTFGPTSKLLRVTSNATVGNSTASAELVLKDNNTSMFVYGAFGDTNMLMTSQSKIDSYNSTLGSYASQAVNGAGSNMYAGSEGNTGSNGNVKLEQNAMAMGDVSPGVSGTLTQLGNSVISGSTSNLTTTFDFPPITVPSYPSLGNVSWSNTNTLPSGNYHYMTTTLNTGSLVTVIGPATLVFDSLELKSNANLRFDTTNGPVQVYVMNDFLMNSNTLVASLDFDPRDVSFNLLSDNIVNPAVVIDLDDIQFESNAKFYGTIYGPDAYINIESNFELFGSVIAEKVRLASNSRVHYDEALGSMVPNGMDRYTRVAWRAMH